MSRTRKLSIALLLGVSLMAPAAADARRAPEARRAPPERRAVVVAPGWPVHRPLPRVIRRRPALVVRVAPVRFLPVVVWRGPVIVRPGPEGLVWQDSLFSEEGWAETVFDSNQRGRSLALEIVRGRVEFDFAEIVFANGDSQVVDFSDHVRGPGSYALLDFADGRRVDHVRLVARSRTGESRVALMMQK